MNVTRRITLAALAAGAARVNLGTAALEDPEWTERVIAEHGDKAGRTPTTPLARKSRPSSATR